MADMAMDFASILSAEYADKMMAAKTPDVVDKEPIGTGPFQFVSYQKDAVIRYKAFDQHWGGRPKIDNLVYAITTDASVRYAKLKTGECHVMAFPKPGRRRADEERSEHQPRSAAGPERRLHRLQRREEAVRLEARAPGAQHGGEQEGDPRLGVPGCGADRQEPDPPTLWGYNDKIADYPYDPVKAKALLAQAGYPNGTEVELWYLPVTRPYNPTASAWPS
jgi:dipeptide transport system substrate-binding protein